MPPKDAEHGNVSKPDSDFDKRSFPEATSDEVPILADHSIFDNMELRRPQCPSETPPNAKAISDAEGPSEAEQEDEDPRDRELRERYNKKTFGQKYFLEIVVTLHTFATMMHSVPLGAVFLQKACRNELGYPKAMCEPTVNETIQNEVQKLSNHYSVIRDIVSTAPGAIAAIVVGQYMTRYGMKAPLLNALTGAVITCLCQMITFYQMSLPLYLNILAEIPGSMTGGAILVSTSAYTSIGLRVPSELRMFRMMLVGAFFGIPIIFAILIGGRLFTLIGMVWLEALCALILVLPTYMVMFRFKDLDISEDSASDSWRDAIWDTLVGSIRVSWTSLRKVRPNNGREQLICTLLIFLFGMSALSRKFAFAAACRLMLAVETRACLCAII